MGNYEGVLSCFNDSVVIWTERNTSFVRLPGVTARWPTSPVNTFYQTPCRNKERFGVYWKKMCGWGNMCSINDEMKRSVFETFRIDDKNVKIEFTDNIQERSIELAGSPEVEEAFRNEDNVDKLRGRTITPDKDGEWHVLISTKSENFRKNMWISTLSHELTHVSDLSHAKDYSQVQHYYQLMHCEWYEVFYVWTEAHAERNGLYLLQSYHSEGRLEFLKEQKYKTLLYDLYLDKIKSEYDLALKCASEKNDIKYLYYLAHATGRVLAYYDILGEIDEKFCSVLNKNDYKFMNFIIKKFRDDMSFDTLMESMEELTNIIGVMKRDISY